MSYYDKYLKYKNKYLQYKNSLELNMQGGRPHEYPPSPVNTNTNNIFHINNLTETPTNDRSNKPNYNSYKHNKILSIERLTDTPRISEFAGGAYKRKIKSKREQDKLLKLLDMHTGSSEKTEDELLEDLKNNPHRILGTKHHYFAGDISSSSTSSDSLGI